MPNSNVILLTDPSSKFTLRRSQATTLAIPGDYSRGNLMFQRIKSYIVRSTINQYLHFLIFIFSGSVFSRRNAFFYCSFSCISTCSFSLVDREDCDVWLLQDILCF